MQENKPQAPAASPQVRWVAVLLGVAFIALGAAAIYDLLAPQFGHELLSTRALEFLQAPSKQTMGIGGAIAALIGLLMVVAALSPRPKRYRLLRNAKNAVWVRRVDIARFSTATAKGVEGVSSASTLVRGNNVKVQAQAIDSSPATREHLEEKLTTSLQQHFGEKINVTVTVDAPADVQQAALPVDGGDKQ